VGMWMAPFRNNRWAFRRSALPIMGRNLTAIRWLHLSSWIMVLQWSEGEMVAVWRVHQWCIKSGWL
jgi:hypothetical protein